MADRTISIAPLSPALSEAAIGEEFKAYSIERIALDKAQGKAFVEFTNPDDVETLAMKYEDCKVPAFSQAEIGYVEDGFKWPQVQPQASGSTAGVEVNEECLIRVYNCSSL